MPNIWTPSQQVYTYEPLDMDRLPSMQEILLGPDPRWFLELFVKIPTQQGIRSIAPLFPWEHQVLYQGITQREFMLKSREIGSTTLWSAVLMRETITHPGANFLIAANKEDSAVNAIRNIRTMVENLPDMLRPRIGKNNETMIEFPDLGNYIKALPGTVTAGRSERATYLLATEMAYWENDEEYFNAVSNSLVKDATIVIESTAGGLDNLFHDIWFDASSHYRKHFWGWTANPDHDAKWYTQKRKDMPNRTLFTREHPETPDQAFIGGGDSYFDADTVAAGQTDITNPLEFTELPRGTGWVKVWKHPLPGRQYVFGVDPSEGKGATVKNPDYSDVYVRDWRTGDHVMSIHCHLVDNEFAELVHQYAKEYNNAHLAIERNGSAGLAVIRGIQGLGYSNFYYEVKLIDEVRGTVREAKDIGWVTNKATKRVMLAELYDEMKSGDFIARDSLFWDQAKSINRATLEASGRQHDDMVVAAAIAAQASKRYVPNQMQTNAILNNHRGRGVRDGRSWAGMWG